MTAPVGVVVVGSGSFAQEHVRILADHPDVEVTAVVGSDIRRTISVASLAPGAQATTELDRALADPRVIAVDVCGASDQHAWATIAAGNAGKHVQVEKPAALSLADFDRMVDAVTSTGRTLVVGQTVRFQPVIAGLRAEIVAGSIGRPRLVHLSWYAGHVWPGGCRAWQYDVGRSGGHPVHNGSHSIDLATWLLGRRPVRVFARSFRSFATELPVPDSFHVSVRFDDDALALLDISYALRERGRQLRRIVVAGTTGTLSHHSDGDPALAGGGPTALTSIDGALHAQLSHWIDVVTGRAEPLVRVLEVRAALAAALAAQQSLEQGRPIEISPDPTALGQR